MTKHIFSIELTYCGYTGKNSGSHEGAPARNELGGGADSLRAFGPVGCETRIGIAGGARNVGVADHEIIFRAGFEEFLLQRFPRSFVQPQMNLRDLIAHLLRLRSQLE